MTTARTIYCCGCSREVSARLTDGGEIYPHRKDLAALPFYKCDGCGNYVGTHYKSTNPLDPLGNIPTPEIRKARQHIHKILDPLWKRGRFKRGKVYRMISDRLGYKYHTAEIVSVDEARKIYRVVRDIARGTA